MICDLTDLTATTHLIDAVKPNVVIHTQAWSDVDQCEEHPETARLMNVQTVEHLCRACAASRPLLIAISTDYVFDGAKGRPYTESDEPRPLSRYGKTKLEGEQLALRYPVGVVVRPSTLFGPGRMNFCQAIVERCQQGQPIEAFADQTTSPTYTEDLAEGLERLMEVMTTTPLAQLPRIYHLTNAGSCTRVEFARRVAALLGCPDSLVRPIRMQDQRRPAPRPAYSALASEHVGRILGRALRPWHEALSAYVISQGWSRSMLRDRVDVPDRDGSATK